MLREYPSLETVTLKSIAKQPSTHVSENSIRRALRILPKNRHLHVMQKMIHYVIEAGRMTDDIIPLDIYDSQWDCLYLSNSKLSDRYVMGVADQCPNLLSLHVDGCLQIDDYTVQHVIARCSSLQTLSIGNCRKVTNRVLDVIGTRLVSSALPPLKSINISGNFNITPDAIHAFLENENYRHGLALLEEIFVSGLAIHESDVVFIADACPKLTGLGVSYCNVTEPALRHILGIMGTRVERLHIAWLGCTAPAANPSSMSLGAALNVDISCAFLLFLATNCPRIVELDICGLRQLNLPTIQQYLDVRYDQMIENPSRAQALKCLKGKFIINTSVTQSTIEQFISSYPNTVIEL